MCQYPLLLHVRPPGMLIAGFQGSPCVNGGRTTSCNHRQPEPLLPLPDHIGYEELAPWPTRRKRTKSQDNPKPAERETATWLEQHQPQPWGFPVMQLTGCWQNGIRKTVKKKKTVLQPCRGVSCTLPRQQPTHLGGAKDLSLTHTCKCPVFPCLTNWKASTMEALRNVHVIILLCLWVRHNFWMQERVDPVQSPGMCLYCSPPSPPPGKRSRLPSAVLNHPLSLQKKVSCFAWRSWRADKVFPNWVCCDANGIYCWSSLLFLFLQDFSVKQQMSWV